MTSTKKKKKFIMCTQLNALVLKSLKSKRSGPKPEKNCLWFVFCYGQCRFLAEIFTYLSSQTEVTAMRAKPEKPSQCRPIQHSMHTNQQLKMWFFKFRVNPSKSPFMIIWTSSYTFYAIHGYTKVKIGDFATR